MAVKTNFRFKYRWKERRPGGKEGSGALNILALTRQGAEQEAWAQLRQKYPDYEITLTYSA